MKIRFEDDAQSEFDAAVNFYIQRDPDIATDFLIDYDKLASQVLQFPHAGTPVGRDVRRVIFAGFPYQLIYRVEADDIVIYAVAHTSRRPSYWRTRIVRKG